MEASRVPEATLAEERRTPDALGFAAPPVCKGQVSFSPPAGSSWPQQLLVGGQARALPWECSGFSCILTSEVASPWPYLIKLPNVNKGRFLEEESGNDG